MHRRYYVLTGPTASGKTAWLGRRALSQSLSIVHSDSRQVYRHMDIGTGKADSRLLLTLTQYGLDLIEPTKNFSVYQYLSSAAEAFQAALTAAGELWLSGGTGLYIRAVIAGLPLGAAPRPLLREALQQCIQATSARHVAESLGLELRDPDNPVRVLRAAEAAAAELPARERIYGYAGLDAAAMDEDGEQSTEEFESARATLSAWECAGVFVLDPGPEELARRIEERVATMFQAGLLEEVAELRRLGYGEARVVREGIAYREAGEVLDGRMQLEEAVASAVTRTRQYAKRQRTYFRGMGWPVVTVEQLDAAFR